MSGELLRFLGLMRRAGKLEAGEAGVKSAVLSGKARRILLAADASPNAVKRAEAFSARAGVPIIRLDSIKPELSEATGTAGVAMYAICDEGFSQAFEKKMIQTSE